MALGLVGQKVGMTRLFTDDGGSIPVTVISVADNRVTQIKSNDTDGYTAIQVTTGDKKASHVNKALSGHYAKSGTGPGVGLWEFRVEAEKLEGVELGSSFTVDLVGEEKFVDVTGVSIGKGFAGNVKRNNFSMQDATHGNSLSHRASGSIGQNQTPGRVFKGKKMAGHMGAVKRTAQNLELVKVDRENGLLLVRGAVPGAKGGRVIVKASVKKGSASA